MMVNVVNSYAPLWHPNSTTHLRNDLEMIGCHPTTFPHSCPMTSTPHACCMISSLGQKLQLRKSKDKSCSHPASMTGAGLKPHGSKSAAALSVRVCTRGCSIGASHQQRPLSSCCNTRPRKTLGPLPRPPAELARRHLRREAWRALSGGGEESTQGKGEEEEVQGGLSEEKSLPGTKATSFFSRSPARNRRLPTDLGDAKDGGNGGGNDLLLQLTPVSEQPMPARLQGVAWGDYERAVRDDDLERALRVLEASRSSSLASAVPSAAGSAAAANTTAAAVPVGDEKVEILRGGDAIVATSGPSDPTPSTVEIVPEWPAKARGGAEGAGAAGAAAAASGVAAGVAVAAAGREEKGGSVSGLDAGSEFESQVLRLLDLGLAADDFALVGRAYGFLQSQGLLRSFGRYYNSVSQAEPRYVTPMILKQRAGLEAANLAPQKFGTSSLLPPLLLFSSYSLLNDVGVDVRPLALLLFAAAALDSIYLGGAGWAQIVSSLWLPYRRRVLVHEAGHVVAAYLLGCPVRGVVLNAFKAMDMGIQGQAGTQFWDPTLERELALNRLTAASIDRYSVVLFAGIAAEAMVYGRAEGGESDENLFKGFVSQLQPPWEPAKVSNQARWAVLQAFSLLKEHRDVHSKVVESLERGEEMSKIAQAIEGAMEGYKNPRL